MEKILKSDVNRVFIWLLPLAVLSGCVAVPYGSPYYGSPYPSSATYEVYGYGPPVYAAPPVYLGPPLILDFGFGFRGGHGGRGHHRWGHGRR